MITVSVSLHFDEPSKIKLQKLTEQIADVCSIAYEKRRKTEPHITLGMFHIENIETLESIKNLAYEVSSHLLLSVNKISSFYSGDLQAVFYDSKELFFLNSKLHKNIYKNMEAGANRFYLPKNWIAHIALATKLNSKQFEEGIKFVNNIKLPFEVKADRIILARTKPYTVIESIRF